MLVAVVAQRYSRKAHRPPVTVSLAVEQVPILELGTDVCIGDAAGELEIAAAAPIGIVQQSRLRHRPGHQYHVAENGRAAQLGKGTGAAGAGGMERVAATVGIS